jgi:hypothetical protein
MNPVGISSAVWWSLGGMSASWPSRPGPGMKVKAMTAKMDDVFSGL